MAAPVAGNVTYNATIGRVLETTWANNLTVNSTDPDGDSIWISAVGTPTYGTLVGVGPFTGKFVYIPDETFVGTATFGFTVRDASNNTSSASAIINCAEFEGVFAYTKDSQAFFQPVLKAHTEMRYSVSRNNRLDLEMVSYTEDEEWQESTQRTIVLATNTSSTVNFGGVYAASYLFLETDNPIQVSSNTTKGYWPVSGFLALAKTEVQTLILLNESTTTEAIVRVTLCE